MDLNSLSDEELAQLAGGKKPKSVSLESLSDDELKQLAGETPLEDDSLLTKIGKGAVNAVIKAGNVVDSYTGAPTRSAISAIQDNKNPLSAFVNQFGRDNSTAPSGKDIALKQGFTDEGLVKFTPGQLLKVGGSLPGPLGAAVKFGAGMLPNEFKQHEFNPSSSDLVGFGINIAADPLNLIPGTAAIKGSAKGVGKTVGTMARGAAKVGEVVSKAVVPERAAQTAEKLFTTARKTADATKEALSHIFNPKQASDFNELAAIAKKNGIDPTVLPESVEFGSNSVISRGARSLREGPAGQPEVDAFENAYYQVQGAADKQIEKIGLGAPLTQPEAGNLIKKGYDDAVDKLFNDVDFTYNQVIKQSPGISLTPKSIEKLNTKLNGIEKFAIDRFEHGITSTDREQGNQLLKAITAVRKRMSQADPKAGTFGSLEQVYGVMSDIGRHAFKQGKNALNDVPVDKQKFQELYFSLRDEFINSTADQLGPDIAESLISTNHVITDFNKNKRVVSDILGNEMLAPERVFQGLVLNGDTKKIDALREILSPEQFQQLKGTLLESLVKRNPDGTISFGNLYNAMQNKRNVLGEIFEPQEISDFAEVIKLGHRFGPVQLSTSGTGGSNLFRNIREGVESGVTNRATLDILKDRARNRSNFISTKDVTPSAAGSTLKRTGADDALKYAQIVGAQSTSKEKEKKSATERRLEEIKRKRESK